MPAYKFAKEKKNLDLIFFFFLLNADHVCPESVVYNKYALKDQV